MKSTTESHTETGATGKNFHLGYSRVSSFQECPLKYKFSYVDGIRTPGGMPMRRGTAYHACLEWFLLYKLEHGKPIPEKYVDKIAVKSAKAENLSDSEIARVIDAARFYYAEMYPKHDPLGVEEDFKITRGGVEFTGRIDLIERDPSGKGYWITDHKFSYDTWAEPRAKYGCQPIIYQWAGDDYLTPMYGMPYLGFRYNIIKLFPTPLIQVIEIPRIAEEESDWWEEQVAAIAGAIQAGYFPAHATEKTCSFCDHKKRCKPCVYKLNMDHVGKDLGDDFSNVRDVD